MVRKNIMDNLTTRQDNLAELEKKHKKAKDNSERESLEFSMKSIEEQIAKMEDKKKDLDTQLESYTNQVQSFAQKEFTGPKIINTDKKE